MEKKKRDGDVKTAITTVVEETKAATNGPLVFSIRQQQSTGGNGGISTTAGHFTSLEENTGTHRQAQCLCKELAYVYKAVYLSMCSVAGNGW